MKRIADDVIRYHRTRRLTEYDRRLLAALGQGWPISLARNVEGAKRGISPNQARLTAYFALIKLKVDVNAEIGSTSLSSWCYQNAGFLSKKVGERYFKAHPHNDDRRHRLNRDLYIKIIRMKLDGIRQPKLCVELDLSVNNYNRAIAFWHRLLPLYLELTELDLVEEPFQYWKVALGYDRHKAILEAVSADWGPFDRPEEVYRRVRERENLP